MKKSFIKNYNDFAKELSDKIKSDENFYYELLITVIKSPQRYTGIFRVSNANTKLLQNVTQSREIKFGDFMEELITWYINAMGYENIDKNMSSALLADQLFRREGVIYLIEQKIRDDHDSTKKKGKSKYHDCIINAVMWFIDDGLKKNRNYYREQAALDSETAHEINIHIMYGGELFTEIFDRPDVWEEICEHLTRNKLERSKEKLDIPDFDTSKEMLEALRRLKREKPSLYEKLLHSPEYEQLRTELFPTRKNFNLA